MPARLLLALSLILVLAAQHVLAADQGPRASRKMGGVPTAATAADLELYSSLLFGMGPAADQAAGGEWVKAVPLRILSSWFNGTDRAEALRYMRSWRERGMIDEWWNQGYVLHVITYEPPGTDYHISPQFLADAQSLAQIFGADDDGRHQVLFSLATEFQTYTSPPNRYDRDTSDYYDTLQRQLLEARRIIRATAPNARVSLDWGSWQVTWDNPSASEGLSMVGHFDETMREMDFVSFQLMSELDTPNAEVVLRNLDVLGQYNPHLMVSHYRPDSGSQRIFDRDLPSFFDAEFISSAREKGLFAFSFMDGSLLERSSAREVFLDGVRRYTSPPWWRPSPLRHASPAVLV